MGTINPTLPTISNPNSTEDPLIRAALSTIIAEFNGNIDNNNVKSAAAIAYSKLATMNTGQILLGNAGVPTATTLSGDVTVSALGVTAIGTSKVTSAMITDDTITNADVNSAAAIAKSKLALTNSIVNGDLTALSVATGNVQDAAVTSRKFSPQAGLKAATADVVAKTSADGIFALTGASQSITPAVAGSNILVIATFDIEIISLGAALEALALGYVYMDGAAQTGNVIFNPSFVAASGTSNERITLTAPWLITGVSAAAHTIDLRAQLSTASYALTTYQAHSRFFWMVFS